MQQRLRFSVYGFFGGFGSLQGLGCRVNGVKTLWILGLMGFRVWGLECRTGGQVDGPGRWFGGVSTLWIGTHT